MEFFAVSKSVRVAPRKVRLVADAIRSLSIDEAIISLSTVNKRGAVSLNKTLKSAIANAKNNSQVNVEDLKIKTIDVLEAPSYKRFHPSTRGRVHPYKRRGSHIKIILETKSGVKVAEKKSEVTDKKEEVNGTKS